MTLERFKTDLHIHTCLSPCADSSMRPTAVIEEARRQGLDCIAICDHNATDNVEAAQQAGNEAGIVVLGGLEITSSEEAHILAIFDNSESLRTMHTTVQDQLPGANDPTHFGDQLIADADDNIVGSTDKLLIGATEMRLDKIVDAIHKLKGLAIASHVDRPSYSVISQLGFIPDNVDFDALELSFRAVDGPLDAYAAYGLPLITSSDAHFLTDIGKSPTTLSLAAMSFEEICMALKHIDGRTIST